MKILIVTQYFWPENFKVTDFATGMAERGHDITVLTGKPNYPLGKFFPGYGFFKKREEFLHSIRIIRSPLITRGKGTGARLFLNYISFAFFASITAFFRISEKFDVIFVFEVSPITVGIPAVFLKKRFKIPMIFWVLDLWPETVRLVGQVKNEFALNVLNRLVIYIYKWSDRILVSSRAFEESVRSKNVAPHKIVYYPNWAEEIYSTVVPDINKYVHLMPNGFRIMFAGNIGDSQDFESIVKTADLLRDKKNIHWIVLGDGRRKQWLSNEIKKLDLETNFHLLGSFPQEEMPHFFIHCDAMLVTLRDSEIFKFTVPAKVQSYLAFGKPILAMLNGEGSSIVDESGAGITCPAGDFKRLAVNILTFYDQEESKISAMSGKAKKYYNENFNRTFLFKKFEQLYNELQNVQNN